MSGRRPTFPYDLTAVPEMQKEEVTLYTTGAHIVYIQPTFS